MAAKILVVDDSVVDRVIISNMLSDFEVINASDEVLTILANSPRPALSQIHRRTKFPPAFTTASPLLRGDEIATSRGITMPHFAKVLNIRRRKAPQVLLS